MSTPSPETVPSADDSAKLPAGITSDVAESPGTMLRAARERAGLSVGDVATRLRMGVRQIDALERGDYSGLPTGTFLRGFVRNFAKAVNADGEQAIRLLEHSNAEAARLKAASIVVPSQDIQIRGSGTRINIPKERIAIIGGVALMMAAAVWYWWEYVRPHLAAGGRPPARVAASAKPSVPPIAPVDSGPAIDLDNTSGSGKSAAPRAVPDKPALAIPAATSGLAEAGVASNPAVAAQARDKDPSAISKKKRNLLGFTFTGDSWVEVTDANGRILSSRQYHAGDTGEISGAGPLSIVIGNAQVTRMAYNGKEIELAPYTRVSVARVTVE